MEKNYSERVHEIKNEVLDEIRDILGTDARHAFKNPPYVHYVEGEVANTEYCLAVEVWSDGMVVFCTGDLRNTPKENENVTEGDVVFQFEPDSFFRILDNLKKEIREKKLNTLRELVKKAGGSISFDGDFKFDSYNSKPLDDGSEDDRVYSGTELFGLSVQEDGHLEVTNYWEGENHDTEEGIPTYEIDNIIGYVNTEILHGSKEYKILMELLSLEENLYFNFVENGIAGTASIDVDVKGKYCQLDVQDVSRDDSGKLTIYGTIWDEDTQISDYSMEEKDIKPEYLIKIIEAIKSLKPSPKDRMALTDEQKELVENFKKALTDMKNGGVCFVLDDENKQFLFCNGKEIEDLTHGDENGPAKDDGYVDITNKFADRVNCDFNYYFGMGYECLFALFE